MTKTTHKFKCLDCKIGFGIDSEEQDATKAVKEIPARCPKCMKVWGEKDAKIDLQMNVGSMSGSKTESQLNQQRRDNRASSNDAKKEAREYSQSMQREEMVTVQDPEGKKPPQQVPKKMVEGLTEKFENSEITN